MILAITGLLTRNEVKEALGDEDMNFEAIHLEAIQNYCDSVRFRWVTGRRSGVASACTSSAIRFPVQNSDPDSKVHGANMWPIWGRQDPGGPHVGLMDFVIWG